ncbi:MAG: hypothetical protein L0229_16320 [Blastocatellia bacterium]|nr:hypothetical protein [Blastocatellia bacterium]
MKDPLDDRDDPYQRFNDEARKQGKSAQVSLETGPMEIRRLFPSLRPRAANPGLLQEARERLTKPDRRMEVDIYFYSVTESVMPDQPLPEPSWDWELVPLPELSLDADLMCMVTGGEEKMLEPVRFRTVSLSSLTRYDEVFAPSLNVTFDK